MNETQNSNGSTQQGQPTNEAPRRGFTRDFKNKILDEIDALKQAGLSVGDFLRREGLYSSQVSNWRRLRKEGLLTNAAKGRGRPKLTVRAEAHSQLEARNRALEKRCMQMELIIEAQKKIAQIIHVEGSQSRCLK
jgi:transposase